MPLLMMIEVVCSNSSLSLGFRLLDCTLFHHATHFFQSYIRFSVFRHYELPFQDVSMNCFFTMKLIYRILDINRKKLSIVGDGIQLHIKYQEKTTIKTLEKKSVKLVLDS